MPRPSYWLILVVILLGVLVLREPRLQRADDFLLGWFLEQTQGPVQAAPVTLVELSREDFQKMPVSSEAQELRKTGKARPAHRTLSPLEYSLFLQAVLDFEPAVVGIEPVLLWRESDKAQEQVFIDQAMRVPKLLVGLELGDKGKHDLPLDEVQSFPNVSGDRSHLAEFSGVARQPNDDIRLISTPGFINAPDDRTDRIRVPMLFGYRGEVVPSFPLQAIILWLRATPAEVKIMLGSHILLPNGWKIPLARDGTTTINPVSWQSVRRITLNQLLLAAQERERHLQPTLNLNDLKGQIVILRIPDDPLQPPNIFATAIATIQTNAYVRRASSMWGWGIILLAVFCTFFIWRLPRLTSILIAIGIGAGYCLLALMMLSQQRLWIPTLLPAVLIFFLLSVRLLPSKR